MGLNTDAIGSKELRYKGGARTHVTAGIKLTWRQIGDLGFELELQEFTSGTDLTRCGQVGNRDDAVEDFEITQFTRQPCHGVIAPSNDNFSIGIGREWLQDGITSDDGLITPQGTLTGSRIVATGILMPLGITIPGGTA